MRRIFQQEEGSAQMIGIVVGLLVSIIIGVLIWFKINSAIYTSLALTRGTGATAAQNATNTAYAAVNTSANTIWTLFPIVAIVIIAGVILGIVMNFGRGSGA